jgi:phosphonate transport system substrate-binding protein
MQAIQVGLRAGLSAAVIAAFAPVVAGCSSSPYPEVRVELASAPATPTPAAPEAETLRFSVAAMLSPQDTFSSYSRVLERLGSALHVRVELVQRRTYAEVNELLASGKVDAALLCTGGYLELERKHPGTTEVLAVPVIRGESTYRSYVLVPAGSRARTLAELEGKRFAYTDELSLSGRHYVVHLLREAGRDPGAFFGSVQYTGSHDRSIDAVVRRVVDGAAVDSLIFDQLAATHPELTAGIRVIDRSPPFGAAPVVASTRLSPARRTQLRNALLSLSADPEATAALRVVGFDAFALPGPHLYDGAAAVLETSR